ncbi:Uncharacterised protein [Candidatus Bilamarchaeum dharawalense]|uniref:Uncharacterized protein n=1 Tax=Candidatus Bilamarchaeum dharawalense TaxID=2885759 RepID=A0A5E4LP15_9ARCH|nr:Uncharacterised protein [Candidatus Bilamarchaeum dharawalense]
MNKWILFLLAALLVFGCTMPGTQNNTTPKLQIPGSTQPEKCTFQYSFSELETGVLGESSSLTATVTCAAGKDIVVKFDGAQIAQSSITTNATTPIQLEFAPPKDGGYLLTVEIDGETVYSKNWVVNPVGNDNLLGADSDGFSFKEWRAVAFQTDSSITPARIRIYMKRLDARTEAGNNILVELRADNNNKPGPLVAAIRKPTTAATLSYNWINFDFTEPTAIPAGKYWMVMKVEQTLTPKPVSDTLYVHYRVINKEESGNDYTKQMMLTVDPQTSITSETEWQTLPYDKVYTMVLTTNK